MHRVLLLIITALTLSFNAVAAYAENIELQGYGAFSNLNKDWMLMALYVDITGNNAEHSGQVSTPQSSTPQRLEIKIAPEKLSQRRFRSLWLNALAIEHGAEKMAAMDAELSQFFNIIQDTLQTGDTLIIERSTLENGVRSEVRVNYHTLANLSAEFLPLLVQSLVGKHPPTQALKTGLTGEDSLRSQTNLGIRFDRLEPTLPRIAEISRWGKGILASYP